MNISTRHGRSLASRWLSIASASTHNLQETLDEREMARRSDLIAWLALGMLGGLVMVSPIAIGDGIAALAFLCFLVLQIAAISLNRAGHISLAGIVLVVSFDAAIFAYMWSSPLGLTMGQLPNYDAFAVSVVIAASVLPRRSGFVVAALNSAAIVADYLIRPHNANVIADAALYPSVTNQTVSLLVRPIALQFVFALVAFLWVRGTDLAIRRANRAEEIAILEYRELERTSTLEEGVRYLHQTLAEWAQGNFAHRVPLMPLGILEQIRGDLNAFMERYGPIMDASYYLRWLQTECSYLTAGLEGWLRGQPVVWPEPSGTPLDHAINLLRAYGSAGAAPPPPGYASPASTPVRPTGAPRFPSAPPVRPPTPPRATGAPYMPPSPPPEPQQSGQQYGDAPYEPGRGMGGSNRDGWP